MNLIINRGSFGVGYIKGVEISNIINEEKRRKADESLVI